MSPNNLFFYTYSQPMTGTLFSYEWSGASRFVLFYWIFLKLKQIYIA